MKTNLPTDNRITIYESSDGKARVEVRFYGENVWLSQKLMAELFDTTAANVNMHLKNIYKEREIDKTSTIKEFLIVQKEGGRKILQSDVSIAKNYLRKNELKQLNQIVSMYLDYAELQASRGRSMTMHDWRDKLEAFIKFNEREILRDKGKISHEAAQSLAEKEYEIFRIKQDKNYVSDFDKIVKQLKIKKRK
ncbi:hypothetical protein COW80_01880 [Candidatus Beckwithbacteria bacterium CG22_combo_CG10-13_8_21_14_all_01_47_9]|uniref:Cell filamentation protein Fic n=2 Tax=Candidatus Beckwithiibacteriota TaxID=1752726 RepID=A0A2H0E1W9_9BACT|nr:MAG: hypothetical protein COW80_01880 [Candidatus Beckwithbacteria bacterium CG22_combo_CG10-13_8_21_14_all_01_47_9]PJC66082.1 MAG: hypothetical protein CO018_03805 [Candidatus Beckwithbacteria bacterium CG_4_9_14_0_2_um_filter_47_11]